MELLTVPIEPPSGVNLILGQAHFIKTVEDLHEALVTAVPDLPFGLAFCEASGPALVRWSGTDSELSRLARESALKLAAGHSFLILMRQAFPINVMHAVKRVPEVCSIFCASANPIEVVVAQTDQGRGILGVIDGVAARGIETETQIEERKALLRQIGYKS